MTIDFAQVRRDYPLRAVAEQLGVKIAKRTHRYDLAFCPFHADSQPSLQIYDDQMHCHTGCLINGGEFADVLDFVKELYGCRDLKDAYSKLTGHLPDPPKLREVPKPQYEYRLSWRDVQRGQAHQAEAVPYFVGRGVSHQSIGTHRMGKYVEWKHGVIINGAQHIFSAGRYTLPDIAFGGVRNIELRLDEADAQRHLQEVPDDLRAAAMVQLELSIGQAPNESQLTSFLFGAKYLRVPGGVQRNLIFNIERAITRVEGGWFMRELPYLLVHEGALKALATEDSCDAEFCYPSISCKGAAGLAHLYNVKELIIVQDNEADKVKNGKTFNPGQAYAERALAASGRRQGDGLRIVLPPEGFKAADDLVAAGQIHEWLAGLGLAPVRRARPAASRPCA